MIQRIQSLYLLLTTILSVLFLSGEIIKFIDNAGASFIIGIGGLVKATGETSPAIIEILLPLSILLVLIPIISFSSIFLFRKRKLQLKFVWGLNSLIIILIAGIIFYSFTVIREFNCKIIPGIRLILPVLMLLSGIMAVRAIRKDENLVNSYDRMR
jgi:hypothetical protein